ncbi:Cornifin (SPRR) [Metarhizium rileyi]|uniref:Cornifin (SPRR) n=1 Tax=Metarhizium rileyi (strain RCEF 4871) TaxID=1649241 RepID=A0A162K064_METRR|nr:Cornifin (SPRR) [Metarhizium rileyi RCEF 4871]
MASVTSHTSTHTSPFDFDHTDDESWQYVDYSSGASAHESVGFLPSPASGSLSGYAVVGHTHGHLTSPQASAVSPLSLVDVGQPMFLPAEASFAGQEGFGTLEDDAAFVQGIASTSGNGNGNGNNNRSGLTPHEYLFADGGLSQHEFNDMAPFMSNFFTNEQTMTATDFTPSSHFQTDTSITSWDATIPTAADTQIITLEDLVPSSHSITSSSSPSGCSSQSPAVELDMSKPPIATRKATDAKIEKKTKRPSASQAGKFVIMTPESIASRTGRPNPFECFEAMRATQRGRKGPLANVTKENALQVRRLGACFCCHSRKVKCDKERPCKHCKRLMLHVPQVMCWQFQDFIPILFPEFVRAHFKKGEMVKFLRDNVDCFTARSCEVELFSGPRFSAVLRVDANFFTARSRHVLRHWHTSPQGGSRNMQAQGSAPIGLEFNTAAQRDHLRKRVKGYVADIVNEPMYAEQVTDSVTSTQLPVKILRIVQAYARQSDVIVKFLCKLFVVFVVALVTVSSTYHGVKKLDEAIAGLAVKLWHNLEKMLIDVGKQVVRDMLDARAAFDNAGSSSEPLQSRPPTYLDPFHHVAPLTRPRPDERATYTESCCQCIPSAAPAQKPRTASYLQTQGRPGHHQVRVRQCKWTDRHMQVPEQQPTAEQIARAKQTVSRRFAAQRVARLTPAVWKNESLRPDVAFLRRRRDIFARQVSEVVQQSYHFHRTEYTPEDCFRVPSQQSTDVPDSIHRAVPDSIHRDAPDTTHRDVPDSIHRDVPDTTHRDVPDITHRDVPDITHRDVPDITHRDVPDITHRDVPDITHRDVPDITHRDVPDITHRDVPDITHRYAPDTTHRAVPDTTHRDAPDITHRDAPDTTHRDARHTPKQNERAPPNDEKPLKGILKTVGTQTATRSRVRVKWELDMDDV